MVDRLENDGHGLNLTEQVRDGILNHTGAGAPATLEGRIVKVVDRVAYINHDIDDALRAGVIGRADLPGEEIAILGSTGSERIETLVVDLLEHSEAAGDIAQGDEVGGAMLRLREFMFENVYLAPGAQQERGRIETMLAALFDHYAANAAGGPDRGRHRARARRGLSGRDDRPLRRARALRPGRAPGVLALDGAVHTGLDRAAARDRRHRGADLAQDRPAPGGLALDRPVPLPRGADAVVLGRPRARALPLLRLRGGRRRHPLRHGDRPAGLPGRGGAAGRGQPRGAQARARGPRGGAAPRASRAAAGAGGARHRVLRHGPARLSRGGTGARLPARAGPVRPGAGRLPRGLRAQGLGPAAHGRPPPGLHRGRAAGRRLVHPEQERACLRPLPGADHVPAGRRPRPRAGLRGPCHARRSGREVHQHGRGRALPQGPPAVRHRSRPRRRGQGPARDRGRGLHRRPRPARRGDARDRWRHGHRPDQGPDGRAGPAGGHRGHDLPGPGRGPLGPGGHAPGRPPGRGPGGVTAGGTAARRPGPGGPGHRPGAGSHDRLGHGGPLCA